MPELINIPYYSSKLSAKDALSQQLKRKENYSIDFNPWNYDFVGEAEFSIAYNDDALLVKFDVVEESIQAKYNQPNDPVYRDSCVELFIALDNDKAYYNFEFNCKGTCLAGFGDSKNNRILLDPKTIKSIKASSTFKSVIFRERKMIKWELTLEIPRTVFNFHDIATFKQRLAKLNFYKCGDDLPQPHFLSWRPIESETPNFHLPEFFGTAIFE
jgi:hypothetical protein